MKTLGKLTQRGVLNTDNPVLSGGWTITFDLSLLPRVDCEVYHIAINGPSNSTFQVWLDQTFYDNVARGDINSWDPSQPMLISPGTTIYFHYDVATGTAPVASLFTRSVSPL